MGVNVGQSGIVRELSPLNRVPSPGLQHQDPTQRRSTPSPAPAPSIQLAQIESKIKKAGQATIEELKLYSKAYQRYWDGQMLRPNVDDHSVENSEQVFVSLVGMLAFENFPDIAAQFSIEGSRSRILVHAFYDFVKQNDFVKLLQIDNLNTDYSGPIAAMQKNLIPLFKKHLSLVAAMRTLAYFGVPYIGDAREWIRKKVEKRVEIQAQSLFPLGSLSRAPLSGHGFYALSAKGDHFSMLHVIKASPAASDPVEILQTPVGKSCSNRLEVDCADEIIYQNTVDLEDNLVESLKFRLPIENEKAMKKEIRDYDVLKATQPKILSVKVIEKVSAKLAEILHRNADEDTKFSNRGNPLKRFTFTQGISCTMAPLRAILYLQVQHHVPQPSLTVAQQEELKFLLDLLFFSFKLHCCRNFGSKLSQSTNADKHKSMLTQAYHCLNQERHELLARSKKLAHPLDHQIISQVSTVPSINHNSSLQPR